MAILEQMFERDELVAMDPALRQRIELGVSAGARLARAGQRQIEAINSLPHLDRESLVRAAEGIQQEMVATRKELDRGELGKLKEAIRGSKK